MASTATVSLFLPLLGVPKGNAVWADVLAGVVLILALLLAGWALTRDE